MQGPRQFDGFGQAEGMSRPTKSFSLKGLRTSVPTINGPGFAVGVNSVDRNHHVGALPGFHQRRPVAVVLNNRELSGGTLAQPASDNQPDCVVAPIFVADPDHKRTSAWERPVVLLPRHSVSPKGRISHHFPTSAGNSVNTAHASCAIPRDKKSRGTPSRRPRLLWVRQVPHNCRTNGWPGPPSMPW